MMPYIIIETRELVSGDPKKISKNCFEGLKNKLKNMIIAQERKKEWVEPNKAGSS